MSGERSVSRKVVAGAEPHGAPCLLGHSLALTVTEGEQRSRPHTRAAEGARRQPALASPVRSRSFSHCRNVLGLP